MLVVSRHISNKYIIFSRDVNAGCTTGAVVKSPAGLLAWGDCAARNPCCIARVRRRTPVRARFGRLTARGAARPQYPLFPLWERKCASFLFTLVRFVSFVVKPFCSGLIYLFSSKLGVRNGVFYSIFIIIDRSSCFLLYSIRIYVLKPVAKASGDAVMSSAPVGCCSES